MGTCVRLTWRSADFNSAKNITGQIKQMSSLLLNLQCLEDMTGIMTPGSHLASMTILPSCKLLEIDWYA